MNLYTLGFTQKSAEEFFELIKFHKIKTLIDIRLNNNTQLLAFTKGNDLVYLLKEICRCKYEYCPEYAPNREIFDAYKKKLITWEDYEQKYIVLMKEREAVKDFYQRFNRKGNICLLCSEVKPKKCHRRLLAEMIKASYPAKIEIIHI